MAKVNVPNLDEIEKFSRIIIGIVEKDGIGYIDAITEYCESIGLEIDVAAKLLTPAITSKITDEARNLNLIEKSPVLPF